jgi:hypothetical protein
MINGNTRDWQPGANNLRPHHTPDEIIASEKIITDRKEFRFSLRRNRGGEFVRVDEIRGPARNTIIIPAEAIVDFQVVLEKLSHSVKAV